MLNALSHFAVAPDAGAGKGAGLFSRLEGLFIAEAGLTLASGSADVTIFSGAGMASPEAWLIFAASEGGGRRDEAAAVGLLASAEAGARSGGDGRHVGLAMLAADTWGWGEAGTG